MGSTTSNILACAVTTTLADAVACFIEATDQNSALAPAALRKIVEGEPDLLTPESLEYAMAMANAMASWQAGGQVSWPNGPAQIQGGGLHEIIKEDGLAPEVAQAVDQAARVAGVEWKWVRWVVYVFGSGRSRVALLAPHLPHPNDQHRADAGPKKQYAVVAYLTNDDGSPREETWGYRMAPIRVLAEAAKK